MSPTYEQPLSGQLYGKIGNILQGVAPFYLDIVLQMIDNLKNITPRVTAEELARWEELHQNKYSHLIGIVRKTGSYYRGRHFRLRLSLGGQFQKSDNYLSRRGTGPAKTIQKKFAESFRKKYESARLKYERRLQTFDEVLKKKLQIVSGTDKGEDIDEILLYRNYPMNNLWTYIMLNGYVVPFIDNATVDSADERVYGTSLGYDETSEKLSK